MISRVFDIPFRLIRRLVGFTFLAGLSLCALGLRRKVLIIVMPFGNLGNRLFLYANFIAYAIENRCIVLNPAFHPWRAVFTGTRAGGLACYPPPNLPFLPWDWIEGLVQQLAWVCLSIASSGHSPKQWATISIDGHERVEMDQQKFMDWAQDKSIILCSGWLFISSSCIKRHGDEIRHYFRQVLGNTIEAISPISHLRQTCDLLIGVVIRHGGYEQWMGGKYFFEVSTYIQWMHQAADLYPQKKVGFLICSDAAIDEENFRGFCHVFRGGCDLENRAALPHCDKIISPPSSFAGWAAFMGNIPLQLLHFPSQTISEAGFIAIHNHIDLRDESYPPDKDVTDSLFAIRS